ncbi:MAG: hypothetical protein HUU38_24975 [Anaerolineales bacterium]|nr:hypothetical protein [Anaerolineales bacterium]
MAEIKLLSLISKLRVAPVREDTWDLEDIGRELAKVSEMDTGDAINITYKLFDLITEGVNRGIHVSLGKLGTLGVTADTQGQVKPTFRASSALRTAVKAYGGKFKNAANKGLDDEGFAQTWLKDNLNDTVIMRDGTTRTRASYGL